jgi:hypothetical protein
MSSSPVVSKDFISLYNKQVSDLSLIQLLEMINILREEVESRISDELESLEITRKRLVDFSCDYGRSHKY